MIKFQIIGHIGRDAEVRDAAGKQVANFPVAVNLGKDKTQWVDCALWDKPNVYPYLKKGGKVYLEGSVIPESYQGKEGDTVAKLKMTVYQVELLGTAQPQTASPVSNQSQPVGENIALPEGKLPF